MNRQVFTRDGFRCVYVAPDGRRCTATTQLQVDHVCAKKRERTYGMKDPPFQS
jgi:5-methylcytosine-specific restriction endonuclease McrA